MSADDFGDRLDSPLLMEVARRAEAYVRAVSARSDAPSAEAVELGSPATLITTGMPRRW